MAKKNENKLSYLQMPLPEGRKFYKMTKRSWSGLNYRQTIDTGALSMEKNISTLEAPYLVPSQKRTHISNKYGGPINLFGFGDFLLVVYQSGGQTFIDYIKLTSTGTQSVVYTSKLQSNPPAYANEPQRCIVQFNVYDTPTDTLTGKYTKKLLIYPDCKSMDYDITTTNFKLLDLNADVATYSNSTEPYLPSSTANKNKYYLNMYNNMVYKWVEDVEDSTKSAWKISVPPGGPKLKYAAVHMSRVFGVDDDRVYASGYNDYTNWNLDTVDAYNESNAWCSPAQSNTKAGGKFTGITNFQGHIVCFKRDYMHEIYNTKNPFRIQDIYAEGAIDQRTIQDVDGKLIFVSEDAVKIYTGSNPRIISHNLDIQQYEKAVSGTDGRCYYLYCEDVYENKRMLVYDTYTEQWSEQSVDYPILGFAHVQQGMYMLCGDGYVYKLDTNNYNHDWSFETDLITNETVNIKHVKKIQMFADIAEDANIKVYMLYGDEEFDENTSHLVYESTGSGRKTIRVKPRKTASYGFKLHVEGYGYVKLYELELFMENGGDLYV